MGQNSLTSRLTGQTITEDFFNDFYTALNGDMIGRNTAGSPTSGQNLGTNSIPWGTIRATNLVVNGASVDPALVSTRSNIVKSGKIRSTSSFPVFITPAGAAASYTIYCASTNLEYDVNGTSYTCVTDITKTGLTLAPSSNNTCLVNDIAAIGDIYSRTLGELGNRLDYITIDTVGSEIAALIGKFASFKIYNGADTEYFTAYVENSVTLSHVVRGCYYNSSLNPVNRIKISDNNTITLLKTGFVFLDKDLTTVETSYVWPIWVSVLPGSGAAGDYAYNLTDESWYRYSGSAWVQINRVLIGQVVMDSTNCVGARCVNFYKNSDGVMNIFSVVDSNTQVKSKNGDQAINVNGNVLRFGDMKIVWDITANLATSVDMYASTEQAATYYYLYLSEYGQAYMSDIEPYYRKDLKGHYHPFNTWRCVGSTYNNGSSNLERVSSWSSGKDDSETQLHTPSGVGGAGFTNIRKYSVVYTNRGSSSEAVQSGTVGDRIYINRPGIYYVEVMDEVAGSTALGISRNCSGGADPANPPYAINLDRMLTAGNINSFGQVCWTGPLRRGDFVCSHNQSPNGSSNYDHLKLTYIGEFQEK